MSRRRLAALLFVVFALPFRAEAELCQRDDGSYTNDCTSDDTPVKGGKVTFESPPVDGPGDRPAAAPEPIPSSGMLERFWRDRLRQARRDVREAEKDLVEARRELGSCRARQHAALGGSLYDSCDEGHVEAAELALEEARDYVDNGLFEECRKAETCQPGWVQ
jgi:hypothetical protein